MKIRFLMLSAYNVGGAIRSMLNQANALAEAGYDVEVVSLFRRKKRPAFRVDRRITMRTLINERRGPRHRLIYGFLSRYGSRAIPKDEPRHARFSLASDLVLRRYLGSLRDGVVIAGRPALNIAIARFTSSRVVRIGEDHLNFRTYRPGLVAAMRKWYPKLDAVTVLTSATAEAYEQELGPGVRTELLPNMLPTAGAARAPLENRVVIAAGRLTRQKGFDLLIDAYASVARKHPDWELRIYGSGILRNDLAKQIADKNLTEHVKLMGQTKKLHKAMADASIYVLSSRFEGFPMVLLEAMTHGLPVVAYDCHTGPADILTDGHDGVLVKPRDRRALARALSDLMADQDRMRTLGANALETVAEYDPSHMTPRLAKIFADLGAR